VDRSPHGRRPRGHAAVHRQRARRETPRRNHRGGHCGDFSSSRHLRGQANRDWEVNLGKPVWLSCKMSTRGGPLWATSSTSRPHTFHTILSSERASPSRLPSALRRCHRRPTASSPVWPSAFRSNRAVPSGLPSALLCRLPFGLPLAFPSFACSSACLRLPAPALRPVFPSCPVSPCRLRLCAAAASTPAMTSRSPALTGAHHTVPRPASMVSKGREPMAGEVKGPFLARSLAGLLRRRGASPDWKGAFAALVHGLHVTHFAVLVHGLHATPLAKSIWIISSDRLTTSDALCGARSAVRVASRGGADHDCAGGQFAEWKAAVISR